MATTVRRSPSPHPATAASAAPFAAQCSRRTRFAEAPALPSSAMQLDARTCTGEVRHRRRCRVKWVREGGARCPRVRGGVVNERLDDVTMLPAPRKQASNDRQQNHAEWT